MAIPCENISYWHMWTAKVLISLSIHVVWSAHSLSPNRIIGYYRMYDWRAKVQMRLCTCPGWSEYVHFVHVWRHIFARHSPIITRVIIALSGAMIFPTFVTENLMKNMQQVQCKLLPLLPTPRGLHVLVVQEQYIYLRKLMRKISSRSQEKLRSVIELGKSENWLQGCEKYHARLVQLVSKDCVWIISNISCIIIKCLHVEYRNNDILIYYQQENKGLYQVILMEELLRRNIWR